MCDSDPAEEVHRLHRRIAELEDLAKTQREAAAALEVSERRFRSLVENMRGIIFYRGERDGDIYLYGVEAQETAGRLQTDGRADLDAWHALIHPDDRDRYLALEQRRRLQGEGFTIEFRFAHPMSGRQIWARERAWVVTTPDGQWFNEGYIIDITAEKDHERRLREVSEAAQIANRSKSEFLANMSHELRTPLNAIIGFTEMIVRQTFGPLGSPRYLEYGDDILSSAHRLSRMIEDILDTAKAETSRVELREAVIDVGSIVHGALRMVRARAHRKAIAISTDLGPHLPQLRGDERRLRQILLNLLSNAVKFTPERGCMVISAEERSDGGLTIAVADTGIGMSEKDIPRAFEPFEQVHTGLDRLYEGAGLGLALSRRLAELHDAQLEIESAPGRGTKVMLKLPPGRSVRRRARAVP